MTPAWSETKEPGEMLVLLAAKAQNCLIRHQIEVNLNSFYILLWDLIQLFHKSVLIVHAKKPLHL